MVCRVKFIKLSRVLVPAIRRLPDEIRWTVVLLIIPMIAIILEPSSPAVVVLGRDLRPVQPAGQPPAQPDPGQDQRGSRALALTSYGFGAVSCGLRAIGPGKTRSSAAANPYAPWM